jgi:endoglucanase
MSDTPPKELPFTASADGRYGPDEVGFLGHWAASAGPDSSVEVAFDNGDMCLRGQTGVVQNNDYRTYWGAQAVFDLCDDAQGNPAPVTSCLSAKALEQFVGVGFTLEGSALPWIVAIQFNEAGRATPASTWVQAAGDQTLLFDRTTSPFDASAPPVSPSQLQSITVRAVGNTSGPQSFDFCLKNFRGLFGPDWEAARVPDWLDDPGPGRQNAYVGANLVGAEFGDQNLPGAYGSDYIYPDPEEIDLCAGKGMNIFRIPFRWERLQRELYAELDAEELGRLHDTVAAAETQGATVIIDPHNFARYEDDTTDDVPPKVIGVDIAIEAFADFWGRLAEEFADDDKVWFGLMNEPHDMPTETWLDAANAAIAAIRDADAPNLLLVPGNGWTGGQSWFDTYYGTPNSEVMQGVVDPADHFVFEIHQYLDSDSSGTKNTCVSDTIGVERLQRVTGWLKDQGAQGFLGEFGGSDDPVCLSAIDQLLGFLGENSDVWLGWTVWAASTWNIQNNIRPQSDGTDSLQMRVLLRHLDP